MWTLLKTDDIVPLEETQIRELEQAGIRLIVRPCATEDEIIEHGADADALMILNEPVTAKVLENLPKCRVVSRLGIGVDTIDLDAATKQGIQVTNVPGASIEEVCDHAVAMVLALSRRLFPLDASVRQGQWYYAAGGTGVRRLREEVVGLIGFGRIGRRTGEKLSALGMTVLAYDPFMGEEDIRAQGAEPATSADILAQADYVSIHTPLTPETRSLIGEAELASMKPSACVVNVSRGGIIDEAALAAALRSGGIAGAALDVFEQEPLPASSELLGLDNVILTPHAGHYSTTSIDEMRTTAVRNAIAVLQGRLPAHPVNTVGAAGRVG